MKNSEFADMLPETVGENDLIVSWKMTTACNFDCHYCYSSKQEKEAGCLPVREVIDCLKKTKRNCLLILVGGEVFLIPHFADICRKIIDAGIRISIETNLSLKGGIEEFANIVDPSKVERVYVSAHILEREKLGLTDEFIQNVLLLKRKGFNVRVNYVLHPLLLKRFEKDREFFRSRGIELLPRLFVGSHKGLSYPDAYSRKERALMLSTNPSAARESALNDTAGLFCRAGKSFIRIREDGQILRCYGDSTSMGTVREGVTLFEKPEPCPANMCLCWGGYFLIDPKARGRIEEDFRNPKMKMLRWKAVLKLLLPAKFRALGRRVYDSAKRSALKRRLRKKIYLSTLKYINANENKKEKPRVRYVEVYPEESFEFHAPESFYAGVSSYYEVLKEVSLSPIFIAAIPHGRICLAGLGLAVTTRDGELLHDLSAQWRKEDPFHNPVFTQKNMPAPRKLNKTVFTMLAGRRSNYNYYHWLFDCLPRFHLLCKSGFFEETDLFLVPKHNPGYQRDSLNMLGVPEEKIIASSDYPNIEADLLIATNNHNLWPPRLPPWVCGFLREAFLSKEGDLGPGRKRIKIYIRRSDAPYRKVCNEDEVTRFLAPRGFEILELGKMPFAEQIAKFAAAKLVVGPTGAGLSNIVFCTPGTKVVEMFSPEYVQDIFYQVAQHAMLDYDYLICPQRKPLACKNSHEGLRTDMRIDLAVLADKVNAL